MNTHTARYFAPFVKVTGVNYRSPRFMEISLIAGSFLTIYMAVVRLTALPMGKTLIYGLFLSIFLTFLTIYMAHDEKPAAHKTGIYPGLTAGIAAAFTALLVVPAIVPITTGALFALVAMLLGSAPLLSTLFGKILHTHSNTRTLLAGLFFGLINGIIAYYIVPNLPLPAVITHLPFGAYAAIFGVYGLTLGLMLTRHVHAPNYYIVHLFRTMFTLSRHSS